MKKRMTKLWTLCAAGMILAMVFAGSAMAATYTGGNGMQYSTGSGTAAYDGVAGSGSVNLVKCLTMDQEANVPNVTFAYTIEAGTAQQAGKDSSGNVTSLEVYAGDDAQKVSGQPTIGTAVFAPGQQTYLTVQTLDDSVNTQKRSDGSTVDQDNVTLAQGKKYARSNVAVNFASVRFKEPGVYRYVITEKPSNTDHGITDDSDRTRLMDVYVEDQSGSLVITGYALHNTEADAAVKKDGSSANPTKPDGYANDYETENLTLQKKVSGNQASHDEYFAFTVKLSNGIGGTVLDVDLKNADQQTKTNAINTASHSNPAQITLDAAGEAEVTYWLQGGQEVVINGLPKNTAYAINEDKSLLDREGYEPSAQITGDTVKTASTPVAMEAATVTVEDSALTADTTLTWTNTREGTIPTGILMTAVPGAIAVLAGGAGMTAMHVRRKREA